jgi:hypothetical protein
LNPVSVDPVLLILSVAFLIFLAYQAGQRKTHFYPVPRHGYTTPDLRQLVVKAKYKVKAESVEDIESRLKNLEKWLVYRRGNVIFVKLPIFTASRRRNPFSKNEDRQQEYFRNLAATRHGIPFDLSMVGSKLNGAWEFDVTVRPVLYFQITQLGMLECTEQDIQDAQHECIQLANEVRGMVEGVELEAPGTRATRLPSNVQKELVKLRLTAQAELLTQAQDKMLTGNSPDGVKNCRSALEQVLDELLDREGLGRTVSFKHNLDRLVAQKYLEPVLASSIYQFYYRLVSEDAHDKYSPRPQDAQYILALTEDTISYLLKRLS